MDFSLFYFYSTYIYSLNIQLNLMKLSNTKAFVAFLAGLTDGLITRLLLNWIFPNINRILSTSIVIAVGLLSFLTAAKFFSKKITPRQ